MFKNTKVIALIPAKHKSHGLPKKNYLKLNKPQFFITKSDNLDDFQLKDCFGDLYKVSEEIPVARRNPFNITGKEKIYIYDFNYKNLNFCVK